MPKYKFFEVKGKESAQRLVFKEFNLATANMKRVRSSSQEQSEEADKLKFHAQPMPDFNKLKPKTCVKKDAGGTKSTPFEFSTLNRGVDKHSKLML